MAGNALSGFQGAVIFQKICDAGRAEGVRRIVSRQSGLFESSFEHVLGVGARSGRRDNFPVFPMVAGNKGGFRLLL